MAEPQYTVDLGVLLDVATALLMAAVTMRDLASSLHPRVLAACPPDILNRLTSQRYQTGFDALPDVIRTAAQVHVAEDPDVVAARQIDEEARRG